MLVLVEGIRPSLEVTVRRRGRAVDLTAAQVLQARIAREGLEPILRELVPVDRAAGIVRLDWQEGDLVVADDVALAGDGRALFELEVVIDGEPTPDKFRFRVRRRIPAPAGG